MIPDTMWLIDSSPINIHGLAHLPGVMKDYDPLRVTEVDKYIVGTHQRLLHQLLL